MVFLLHICNWLIVLGLVFAVVAWVHKDALLKKKLRTAAIWFIVAPLLVRVILIGIGFAFAR
jgi:hypothetical protein